MKEKINIAELLKDCPKGMELDCLLFKDTPVYFKRITNSCHYPIEIKVEYPDGTFEIFELSKEGCIYDRITAKCVIFPKGKTTWEGFQRPFKDGDVIYVDNIIAIFSHITENGLVWYHCYYCNNSKIFRAEHDFGIGSIENDEFRFATEEEKQKLFNAIKNNGYKWNPETKTMEELIEPKFKVGDKIRHRLTGDVYKILFVLSNGCGGGVYDVAITNEIGKSIDVKEQDDYELVPNKFDITTLKPFESRVLMRSSNAREWTGTIFSHYSNNKFYGCGMCCDQCIPYEGNEHLLGTTNDCDEYYKTWKYDKISKKSFGNV